jgi:hypothetical protein
MVDSRLRISGPCFRHFRFDHRGQGTYGLEKLRVEVALYKLDPEMPFDLQNQLEHVDRIDFQISAEKWVIVAQVRRCQISDPQAAQNDRLELFANARHISVYEHDSIPQRSI